MWPHMVDHQLRLGRPLLRQVGWRDEAAGAQALAAVADATAYGASLHDCLARQLRVPLGQAAAGV